jgi:transposase InsO family protein
MSFEEIKRYQKARRNNYDNYWCYHSEAISNLERQGFQINEDLVPLYAMIQTITKYKDLSKEAKKKQKWMDYYEKCQNASKTCRYFGIARKTFYKWKKRYEPNNLYTLEEKDRAPHKRREREITTEQERRIVKLRKKYIRYGKIKLSVIYKREYKEDISSWKVQKIIEKYNLYYHPRKAHRIAKKRRKSKKKKLITKLKKKPHTGFLWCLDLIVRYWNNKKRYIYTGIDHYGKIAYARMYKSKNSMNGKDFLEKLWYLSDGKIEKIQTDNGTEFEGWFDKSVRKLELDRYYSRAYTPKDNTYDERFNRTVQEEFIDLGNVYTNPKIFNPRLTEWLVEYNFNRPHESLNYKTPIEFSCPDPNVLPMYSSRT